MCLQKYFPPIVTVGKRKNSLVVKTKVKPERREHQDAGWAASLSFKERKNNNSICFENEFIVRDLMGAKIWNISKILNKIKSKRHILSNVNKTKYDKWCLLSYIKAPFIYRDDFRHQNWAQEKIIAKIFGIFGYNVDVVDYNDTKVKLKRRYDAVFDICVREHSVYEYSLDPNAKRIVYFTGGEPTFANKAELARIENLYRRRKVRVQPRRQSPQISKEVETFDAAIIIGNEYNISTYNRFSLKRLFHVPNSGYDFRNIVDFQKKDKKSFLYFGSSGCVHKGLDLLLEIFAEDGFPCKLYVCGNFKQEKDFCEAYKQELYHRKNIFPMGMINIASDAFREIANTCAYTVLPSCSEARAGSVAVCLSAGIVAICSRECGYNDDEVINLEDCEIDTIRRAILKCSNLDDEEVIAMCKKAMTLANRKFTLTEFEKAMYNALSSVLQ